LGPLFSLVANTPWIGWTLATSHTLPEAGDRQGPVSHPGPAACGLVFHTVQEQNPQRPPGRKGEPALGGVTPSDALASCKACQRFDHRRQSARSRPRPDIAKTRRPLAEVCSFMYS
jgi:hypothetical protein